MLSSKIEICPHLRVQNFHFLKTFFSCQIKRLQMSRTILNPPPQTAGFFGGGSIKIWIFLFYYLFSSLIIVHANTYVRSTYGCVTVLSCNAQCQRKFEKKNQETTPFWVNFGHIQCLANMQKTTIFGEKTFVFVNFSTIFNKYACQTYVKRS